MTDIKRLEKRLNELPEPPKSESHAWFGFRSAYPAHSYDPPNARFDLTNMNGWELFCYLQWTATELDEYIAISVWNAVNHYPLSSTGAVPDLRTEAEALHNRKRELELVAQGRAEELDRRDPEAWPRWREVYKRIENESQEASDEPASDEPPDDSIGGRMRLLWGWKLAVLEEYRKRETQRGIVENGEVSK